MAKTEDFKRFSPKTDKKVVKSGVLIRLGLWKKSSDPTRTLRFWPKRSKWTRDMTITGLKSEWSFKNVQKDSNR